MNHPLKRPIGLLSFGAFSEDYRRRSSGGECPRRCTLVAVREGLGWSHWRVCLVCPENTGSSERKAVKGELRMMVGERQCRDCGGGAVMRGR